MFSHFTSRLRTVDYVNLMTYQNMVAILHASLEYLHIVCMTCTEKSNIYASLTDQPQVPPGLY
jgi:hypothetical protein